jgi:hypothetical protein
MSNKTTIYLIKLAFNVFIKKTCFGLKSIMNSLSITPNLSSGLLKVLKNRALAHNSFLFMITDSQ